MKNLFNRSLSLTTLTVLLSWFAYGQEIDHGARYIIMFKQPVASMMAPQRAALAAERQKIVQFLQSSSFKGHFEKELDKIHAVVVRVQEASELQTLAQSSAVELVDKERFFKAPVPVNGALNTLLNPVGASSATQKVPWGIKAVKAREAWAASGAGQGSRVLVLDTGIDKDHTNIAPNFEDGKNFLVGQKCQPNAPYPFYDGEGHGTHVSGTILGAQDSTGFTGVAPKARLLMGRVCGPVDVYENNQLECASACSNIAVAEGINWGVTQKVDVISMSLGGPMSSPSERRAVKLALTAGVTLVAASGNGQIGPDEKPVYDKVSFPAALPGVIAVGAVDINNQKASFSQYGPELAVVAPGVDVVSSVPRGTGMEPEAKLAVGGQAFQSVKSTTFLGSFAPTRVVTNELVPAGLGKAQDFPAQVRGKFALVRRGEIMFKEKAENAIRAGAAGLIVYNHEPGLISGKITDGETLSIPVFMIEKSVGEAVLRAVQSGQVVKASLAVVQTDYAAFDGTSMATPHVAGVVALMKAVNKKLTPEQVKQILQSTATPLQPNSNNELGAGVVNAQKAVEASLRAR